MVVAVDAMAGPVSFDRLIRIAGRLAKVEAGSRLADETIHQALGRWGALASAALHDR